MEKIFVLGFFHLLDVTKNPYPITKDGMALYQPQNHFILIKFLRNMHVMDVTLRYGCDSIKHFKWVLKRAGKNLS